jgi:hypothetical protein
MNKVSVSKYSDVSEYLNNQEPEREAISLNYADIYRYFFSTGGRQYSDNETFLLQSDWNAARAALNEREGYFVKSQTYAGANSERKALLSEKVGVLAAKAISEKLFKIPQLFYLDDDSIKKEYGENGAKRPDFFGVNMQNDGFLFEAKGTGDTTFRRQVVLKAKDQLKNIELINFQGVDYTALSRYISAARFDEKNRLVFDLIDPPAMQPEPEDDEEPKGLEIVLKEKAYLQKKYYRSIYQLLDAQNMAARTETVVLKGTRYLVTEVDSNIRFGLIKDIFDILKSYQSEPQYDIYGDASEDISSILKNSSDFSVEDRFRMLSVGLDGILCEWRNPTPHDPIIVSKAQIINSKIKGLGMH